MDRFEHEVSVRYSDLDTYGHVNNAVYGTYCQEARIAYSREVMGVGSVDDLDAVVASLSIDLRASVTEPTSVDVRVWTDELGESSLTLQYELEQDGRLVAEAATTVVSIDPQTGEPQSLPTEWRERIEAHEKSL